MARDWRELFIIDGAEAGAPRAPEEPERRMGRFRRLRESLRKTRQALQTEIQATLFEDLSEETWERLEEALIYADVGAQTTAKVVAQLEQEAAENKLVGRRGAVRPPGGAADRDRHDRRRHDRPARRSRP